MTEYIEMTMFLHSETQPLEKKLGAILVSERESGNSDPEQVWLPKSQVKFWADKDAPAGIVTVSIPEWLATKNGWT